MDDLAASTLAAEAAPLASISHAMGRPLDVVQDHGRLVVRERQGRARSWWTLDDRAGTLTLGWDGSFSDEPDLREAQAAIEAAFALHPDKPAVTLDGMESCSDALLRSGAARSSGEPGLCVMQETFFQQAALWLSSVDAPFPLRHMLAHGRRHPLRPPKPVGAVYRRYIPWLELTLTFRTVDQDRDLARFHAWMNDPRIAHFWQEDGDLAKHRSYLDGIVADPHVIGLVGCFDDEPFGYFEVYWAKEDRIAPFCDAADHDRGWHVLIGEDRFRGKPFVTAWLPSISHYLFLDDCRTQRLVIEPRVDNQKMIRNLLACGYAMIKEFEFPHKRAILGTLLRERFFFERLWTPRETAAPAPLAFLP